MKVIRIILLFGLIGVLSGCAFTASQVPMDYRLKPASHLSHKSKTHVLIKVARIKDERDVSSPNLIIHKKNGYNDTTSGSYLAEKPVATIVRSALVSGLGQLNYRVGRHGQYTLVGTLNSIKRKDIMGFFESEFDLIVNLHLSLINDQDRRIWSDDFVGHGKVETAWGGDSVLQGAFNQAVTQVVRKMQASTSLYQALNHGKA